MTPAPLVIDTDPGIDDAMAIAYAAAHPGLHLLALTTVFGNVPVERATRNALRLVELTGHLDDGTSGDRPTDSQPTTSGLTAAALPVVAGLLLRRAG